MASLERKIEIWAIIAEFAGERDQMKSFQGKGIESIFVKIVLAKNR